jgi:hypothetical protein
MIKPTVGRVVWFWAQGMDSSDPDHQPEAALITHVWSDECVNLCVFNRDGVPFSRTSVTLWQSEGPAPSFDHCEWMPFQKGQAAKTLSQTAADDLARSGLAFREPIDNGDRHPSKEA